MLTAYCPLISALRSPLSALTHQNQIYLSPEKRGKSQIVLGVFPANGQHDQADAVVAESKLRFSYLDGGHFQGFLMVFADRRAALKHAGKRLQIGVPGSFDISPVHFGELQNSSAPYRGLGTFQVLF